MLPDKGVKKSDFDAAKARVEKQKAQYTHKPKF